MDYRGHHNSETPSNVESITVENMARDAIELSKELDIREVAVLGHSIGVSVGLEFYHQAPEKTKALVLANGCARAPLEVLLKSNVPQYVHPLLMELYKMNPKLMNAIWASQSDNKLVHWAVGLLGFNPNLAKADDIVTYIKMLSKLDMIVFLQLLKSYEEYNATTWLHQIHVPTLLISGEKDLITPRDAQEVMHQLIPNSKIESIRNGSHCPQLDLPEYINITIERFLNEHYPAKK